MRKYLPKVFVLTERQRRELVLPRPVVPNLLLPRGPLTDFKNLGGPLPN